MKSKRVSVFLNITVMIILGLLVNGDRLGRVLAQSETDLPALRVVRITVMPFLKGRCGSTVRESLDSSLSQLHFNPKNVSPGSDRALTGYTHEALQKRHGERVVPLAKSIETFEKVSEDQPTDTIRILAQKMGKALKANLVMGGNVWRYKKRVAGAEGIKSQGASVAFHVYLIDVADGKTIWKATFEKTQQSDLRTFAKMGAKWLTADQLARFGVNEVFKKYPF